MSSLIELRDITKTYYRGGTASTVLHSISLSINTTELVAIIGTSGSGKSSLMNIMGLLDKPTTGEYFLNSQDMSILTPKEISVIRNQQIGFIFQAYFMLPRLSLLQNVGLPLTYRELPEATINQLSLAALQRVGIGHLAYRFPNELSGGQLQRAAIARALVGKPSVIFADEPTGALDSNVGQEIMDLFIQLNQIDKKTVVIITHDPRIAKQCARIIRIQDGNLVSDESNL